MADDAVAALRSVRHADAGQERAARSEEGSALLVHVDPFALTPEDWAALAPGLDEVCGGVATTIVVVYRYTRGGRTAWPRAPQGTVGPIAEVRGGPHEIAAYASSHLVDEVGAACVSLGWARR